MNFHGNVLTNVIAAKPILIDRNRSRHHEKKVRTCVAVIMLLRKVPGYVCVSACTGRLCVLTRPFSLR